MSKKVKFLSVLTALSVAASMNASVFAADEGGQIGGTVPADNGTQVWAGVTVDAPDMRIKVTVPTLFAFVVNGSMTDGADAPITVENDGLLLPNVKVTNVQAGGDYDITTVGESTMRFENFSTQADTDGNYQGLAVNVSGSIRNEGSAESRNQWTHVGSKPGYDTADKKKYQLVVNDDPFVPQADGSFGMTSAVAMAAPDTGWDGEKYSNLDDVTHLAKAGAVTEVKLGVNVGGDRQDYQKTEASAKIGTISWSVSAVAAEGNP